MAKEIKVTKNPDYTPEIKKRREPFTVKLSEEEYKEVRTIMKNEGIRDFSKTIRFLINDYYGRIIAPEVDNGTD